MGMGWFSPLNAGAMGAVPQLAGFLGAAGGASAFSPAALTPDLWLTIAPTRGTKVGGGAIASGSGIATLTARSGPISATGHSGAEPVAQTVSGWLAAGADGANYFDLSSTLTLPAADWTLYASGNWGDSIDALLGKSGGSFATVVVSKSAFVAVVDDGTNSATIGYTTATATGVVRVRRSGSSFYVLPPDGGAEVSAGVGSVGAVALDVLFWRSGVGQRQVSPVHEIVAFTRALSAAEDANMLAYMAAFSA